jgi:RND family efflux transporter MFP subunit
MALLVLFSWPLGPAGANQPAEPWRGVVMAVHQAAISTDLALPVAAVGAREGERFKTGQPLIVLDCRRQQQELLALAAVVRETKIAVETNEYLAKRGASNRNDVEVAKAKYDKALAEHSAMRERLMGCVVKAPFDGIVVELDVNAHEMPPPQRPMITILGDRELEIEIVVPSRQLSALGVGTKIMFTVDETAQRYPARIIRRAGAVDPVSQMAKIYATFEQEAEDILPGMSGTAEHVAQEP